MDKVDPQAIVTTNEGQRSAAGSVWESFLSFYRAPCLKQSVTLGFAGGIGIGTLRFTTSRNASAAGTWGAVVGGLLAGSTWFVCRRAMYASAYEEAQLLQRVMAKDPDAIREYQTKLEQRAAQEQAAARRSTKGGGA